MGVSWLPIAVIVVVVGVPLWVFWNDIVAGLRGVDYIASLDQRIRSLERTATFWRVIGSPEWVRGRITAYGGGLLFISILNVVLWMTKTIALRNVVVNVTACTILYLALGALQVWRARSKHARGVRQIQSAPGEFFARTLHRFAQIWTKRHR